MRNIYNITRGQLITLWLFGFIGWLVALDQAEQSGVASFFSVLVPMLLVFYTIGWKSNNKASTSAEKFNLSRVLPSKKKVVTLLVSVFWIISVLVAGAYWVSYKQEELEREQFKQEYDKAVSKVGLLKENLSVCVKPIIEDKYQEELRECNLLKGKIKHDYSFCVSLSSINSPESCLYDHDYQKIDCSEEVVRKQAIASITRVSLSESCGALYDELITANNIIERYSSAENNR